MPIPPFDNRGNLLLGIHTASLEETVARFGGGSERRQGQAILLREVVAATLSYPSVKRVLIWGSFVTAKPEPNDLDYSLVVSNLHRQTEVLAEHRRFLVPVEARAFYGVDRSYLLMPDYPVTRFVEWIDFLTHNRERSEVGIVEINLRGETLT